MPENKAVFESMLSKILKIWTRNRDGVTAIEFSLLAIPYLMLFIGIIEFSIMHVSASLLEGATGSAARLIRTGQIQQGGADPETAFRDQFCSFATVLIDCNDVIIEVRQLPSFTDISAANPQYDEDGNLIPQGFDAGGSGDRVLIRVGYRYEVMTPFISPLLTAGSGSIPFMSTIVLQTEPYEFGGAV